MGNTQTTSTNDTDKQHVTTPSVYNNSSSTSTDVVNNVSSLFPIPSNYKISQMKYLKKTDQLITVATTRANRKRNHDSWDIIIWKISKSDSSNDLKFDIFKRFEFDPNHYGRQTSFFLHDELQRFCVALTQYKHLFPPACEMQHKNNELRIYSMKDATTPIFTCQIEADTKKIMQFMDLHWGYIDQNKEIFVQRWRPNTYNIRVFDINYNDNIEDNKNECNIHTINFGSCAVQRCDTVNKNILVLTRNGDQIQLWKISDLNLYKKIKLWNHKLLVKFKPGITLKLSFSANWEYFMMRGEHKDEIDDNGQKQYKYSTHIFDAREGRQIQCEIFKTKKKSIFVGQWYELKFSDDVDDTYFNVECINRNNSKEFTIYGRKMEYIKNYKQIKEILMNHFNAAKDIVNVILGMMSHGDCNVAQSNVFNNPSLIGRNVERIDNHNVYICSKDNEKEYKVLYF